jgi:hypothetical protein
MRANIDELHEEFEELTDELEAKHNSAMAEAANASIEERSAELLSSVEWETMRGFIGKRAMVHLFFRRDRHSDVDHVNTVVRIDDVTCGVSIEPYDGGLSIDPEIHVTFEEPEDITWKHGRLAYTGPISFRSIIEILEDDDE